MKKIAGKLILILLPLIAAAFLLYPTYTASQLEKKEREYKHRAALAEKAGKTDEAQKILDQFQSQYGADLLKAKQQRLKLGLDLRGGMYVTLEVDVVKLIEESAINEAIDDYFTEVIDKTRKEAAASEEDALDIFLRNFNKIARPKGKSLISYFDIGDVKDASEEKIIEVLRDNSKKSIDQALEVIRQRIDKYGLSEPNIQKQGARRILLELPGVANQGEINSLLQTTARLEFKLVRNNEQIVRAFAKIDKVLADQRKRRAAGMQSDTTLVASQDSVKADTTKKDTTALAQNVANKDTNAVDTTKKQVDTTNPYAGLPQEEAVKRYTSDHPFTSLFATYYLPGRDQRPVPWTYINNNLPEGEYMFRISGDSLKKFNDILKRNYVKSLIPFDLQIAVAAKPDRNAVKQKVEIFDFYCLKKEAELTGDVITDARATFDPNTNTPEVTMAMNSDGADRWARITGANIKKRVAVVLDDRVYSAPVVQDKIMGGRSSITGMANAEEASLLEIVLKAGALKAPVQIIEERVVGPSLGEDSIAAGLRAGAIAVLLVVLFMFIYYSSGGLVADFAVVLNVILILAVLSAFGGTLTMPGIAGIILTIGMAVDANVLIFERIREELWKGRSYRSAIDEGFSKALSAIIDSNVTTFLTGLILYFFGTGPIQGFAMTLMIGIVGTLFTAIMVSRAIIEIFFIRGAQSFNFGQPKNEVA